MMILGIQLQVLAQQLLACFAPEGCHCSS